MVKHPPVNGGDVRDAGSIPGLGRSPGGGHGNPLQYSYLKNPIDRGPWWTSVHRVSKSRTRLSDLACSGVVTELRIRARSLEPKISDRKTETSPEIMKKTTEKEKLWKITPSSCIIDSWSHLPGCTWLESDTGQYTEDFRN